MKTIIWIMVFLTQCFVPSSLGIGIEDPEVDKGPTLSWYVRLYPSNPEYIEVTVDARGLPRKLILREVSFSVEFRARKRELIRKETYAFTDGGVREIFGGSAHRRYFRHPIKSVTFVSGGKLRFQVWEVGVLYETTPGFVELAESDSGLNPQREGSIHLVDSTPSVTPQAFDGEYLLFVNGVEQDGVLIIKYPEANFRHTATDNEGSLNEPLALMIKGHHIVVKFSESQKASNPLSKLDGYLSTQTASSIAGVAWRKDKPFGFYAMKQPVEQPNNSLHRRAKQRASQTCS